MFEKLKGWLVETREMQFDAPQRTAYYEDDPVRQLEKKAVRDLRRMGIVDIDRDSKLNYIEAHRLLSEGIFLKFCCELVNDYHAGDTKLTQLMLRAALRVVFSSNSALLHLATTGKAGAGKNDLIENVIALFPEHNVVRYAAITSKNLWYELEEDMPGRKKKVVNPYHFNHKIIAVTEFTDTSGYSEIKGFGELNEQTEATYKATNKLALRVLGQRALWIASVSGPKSNQEDISQVNRRFINNIIDVDTDQKRKDKIRAVTSSVVNQKNLKDDPRTPIAQAGFELLFASEPVFEMMSNDVAQMVEDLFTMLDSNKYDPSQWKQVSALAECAAVEKQFQRGYVRVEKEDLIEAWFLSGYGINKDVLLNGEWFTAHMFVGGD
jgi:hypothetical protein